MLRTDTSLALVSDRDDFDQPSLFLPENLMREARRQRDLPLEAVPNVCMLDPDGDVTQFLREHHGATTAPGWACYHTELLVAQYKGTRLGVIGCAVGASFAVLLAEQLFASGCKLLVSVTSAGQIDETLPASCTILIDRAIRGEGTSHAYLPPAPMAIANETLVDAVQQQCATSEFPVIRGAVWTTDAPFRETATSLAAARDAGALAVEMEAAALYAFAEARQQSVVCFAHVTNSMAVDEGDFEKGPFDGAEQALGAAIAATVGWRALHDRQPD
ncbi:MAG: nucleoside phosphorylase [Thermomicrobiales bacterium]|jgi:uridine phosphorylase